MQYIEYEQTTLQNYRYVGWQINFHLIIKPRYVLHYIYRFKTELDFAA